MTQSALIVELQTLLEPGKVLTDADSLTTYGKDWTKHFAPAPLAIAFPKTIEQVQAIVRWANVHKVALVPSGGRTAKAGSNPGAASYERSPAAWRPRALTASSTARSFSATSSGRKVWITSCGRSNSSQRFSLASRKRTESADGGFANTGKVCPNLPRMQRGTTA